MESESHVVASCGCDCDCISVMLGRFGWVKGDETLASLSEGETEETVSACVIQSCSDTHEHMETGNSTHEAQERHALMDRIFATSKQAKGPLHCLADWFDFRPNFGKLLRSMQ